VLLLKRDKINIRIVPEKNKIGECPKQTDEYSKSDVEDQPKPLKMLNPNSFIQCIRYNNQKKNKIDTLLCIQIFNIIEKLSGVKKTGS